MIYAALFLAGAFLCNALPHLAAGLQGKSFPTPFAKPRGIGDSSPLVNFLWGLLNAIAGLLLLSLQPPAIGPNLPFAATVAGALALGMYLSLHFGKIRK